MKIIVGLLLLGVVASLFSGLFFLVKDDSSSRRTAKALTYRVGFSLAIIALILILLATGQLHLNPSPY
jgi:hypothetical protein